MPDASEECWVRFEALRQRLKSIRRGAEESEHDSIQAELIELREFVLAALKHPARRPTNGN